jgi:hypothetical protein
MFMIEILDSISNYVGMVGVVLILIAYFYLSTGHWIADSLRFQLLNFIGAWLILYSLYFHWNFSSVVIEIAWLVISLVGIYRALKIYLAK